jgi:drug/metabolite transporter (DMT)-like permease
VKLGKASGRAKLVGTLVGLGGAMLVTFYRGPEIGFMHRLARTAGLRDAGRLSGGGGHGTSSAAARVVGSFLAITSCFSYAIWLSIQARVGEVFPCHYSIAALVCLFGAVQSALLALCFHRDMAHWRLGLNVRLYSSAYAVRGEPIELKAVGSVCSFLDCSWLICVCLLQGIVASGFAFPLMSWCLRERGPLYVAMFGPLIIVFVAVLSSVFLDETLHLGMYVREAHALCLHRLLLSFAFTLLISRLCSALGAVLIVAGLYIVLWGKAREAQEKAAAAVLTDEELGNDSSMAPSAANIKYNGETK